MVNWSRRDCDDHEEIIYGRMLIGLEENHNWRIMMGDDKLAKMISKKSAKREE